MWKIISEQRTNEEGVNYTAYGLRCGDCVVDDLSSEMQEVQSFIELINRNEVSPIHIYDVIEDYFAAL